MADQDSNDPQKDGPPDAKRLPEPPVKTSGPDGHTSVEGPHEDPDSAGVSADAKATGQLGSASVEGSAGNVTGRAGYGDADASGSAKASPDGLDVKGNLSAEAGAAKVDAKSNDLADGLVNVSTGSRVGSGEAHAKGELALTREKATLSGDVGASVVLAEAHGKVDLVITPQRVWNGIVVNGVNAFAQWRKYDYRMQKIQNGYLDHGLIFSVQGGLTYGAEAQAGAHATYSKGEGAKVGVNAGAALGPGASLGTEFGFR